MKFTKSEMIDLLSRALVCGYEWKKSLSLIRKDFEECFENQDMMELRGELWSDNIIC